MKKLEGQIAEVMKEIIYDGDTVIEIEGEKYYLSLAKESETTVMQDVEADPELKQRLLKAKKDISTGKTYTTEKVTEMIEQGKL